MSILDGITRGVGTAAVMNRVRQQNALRDVYQEHGQGILAGDPNAMNALAGVDAGQAISIRNNERDYGFRERQEARMAKQFDLDVQKYAASLDAAQAAKEAEQIRQGVFAASSAQTPEQWDAIATQFGAQDLVGQFENKDAWLNRYATAADILESQAGPKPMSGPGKVQADIDAGILPEGTPLRTGGTSLSVGPDGSIEFGTGGQKPVKLSEKQSQIALFGSMMDSTMPVINGLEEQFNPANLRDKAADSLGTFGNFVRSEDMQKYRAAAAAWAEGALRLSTGAAATQPEIERVVRTYFAEAGDTPETVAYKKQLRDQWAQAVSAASGNRFAPPGQTEAPSELEVDPGSQFQFQNDRQKAIFEKYATPSG
ncbi:hypothetical protein Q5Y75_05650 [Ruegeria sp. 2205SS24-7]|uniref:hypothetical protein n=1 Tax=Ruegeria discodermiae TaxID=3064389 RepID=UPI002741D76C|nr:hypothetical protein [Ruegeria sp. 2205SS24-7]MDP5216695.1 hypothetical protein [Ruegeria sp. 2205SS24-7]